MRPPRGTFAARPDTRPAMPLLLLLETSGPACSVALATSGDAPGGVGARVLAEAEETVPMRHTARLLPLIREVLRATNCDFVDLDAVAVSAGPGSYTALRAGYATAKGLCAARGLPLLTVSTLRALASVALARLRVSGEAVTPVVGAYVPARRDEVYYAAYDAELRERVAPGVVNVDSAWRAARAAEGALLCGTGPLPGDAEAAGLSPKPDTIALHARNLLIASSMKFAAGQFAELSTAEPAYVRPPYITTPRPRL